MDRASGTEAVDPVSISDPVKLKTWKTGIHSFFASRSALKEAIWNLHCVW